jgi:uncharacterized membrane protein
MAKDASDLVRDALGQVVRNAIKSAGDVNPAKPKRGPFSGARGVAAGAGLAAVAPLAYKGVEKLRLNGLPTPSVGNVASSMASTAGDKVGSKLKDTVSEKVDEAGGAGGLVKEAASGLLPGGGGGDGGKGGGMPGVGKGRRMPVQQSMDVAVPLETAYNQWTQFEDWPEFMHRVTRVTQEDDCTVSFATKIWGKTKEFTAKIETQRPDQRIKWRVSQGITHTGVVTFHELAENLTRIELTVDVDPGSLLEKAARGMRHIKRAMRADLHRYKAFIEVQEHETGAWRGVIEDGELVEEHDDSYDEERDYSDIEEIKAEAESEDDDDQDDQDDDEQRQQDDDDDDDDSQSARTNRFKRQAESSGRGGSRTAAASRSSSSRTQSGGGNGSSSKSKRSGSSGSNGSSSKRSSSRSNGSSSKSSGSSSRSNGSSSKRSSSSSSPRSRSNGSSSSKRSGGSSSSSRRKTTASSKS